MLVVEILHFVVDPFVFDTRKSVVKHNDILSLPRELVGVLINPALSLFPGVAVCPVGLVVQQDGVLLLVGQLCNVHFVRADGAVPLCSLDLLNCWVEFEKHPQLDVVAKSGNLDLKLGSQGGCQTPQ